MRAVGIYIPAAALCGVTRRRRGGTRLVTVVNIGAEPLCFAVVVITRRTGGRARRIRAAHDGAVAVGGTTRHTGAAAVSVTTANGTTRILILGAVARTIIFIARTTARVTAQMRAVGIYFPAVMLRGVTRRGGIGRSTQFITTGCSGAEPLRFAVVIVARRTGGIT